MIITRAKLPYLFSKEYRISLKSKRTRWKTQLKRKRKRRK